MNNGLLINSKLSHNMQRQANRAFIFRTIQTHQPVARVDLARITGLSRATVSNVVDELIEESLVEEVGATDSRGGRRPILLRLREGMQGRFAICVELTRSKVAVLAVDLGGRVISQNQELLPSGNFEPANLVELVARQVKILLATQEYSGSLVGVGVGVPGLVDTEHGVIQVAAQFGWSKVPLKEMLESALGVPVHVMNNVKAAALGEMIYSPSIKKSSPHPRLYLSLGQGIGAALLVEGKLVRGASNMAGEFGHITVAPSGPLCTCGNQGCLEAVAGLPALVNRYVELARLEEPSRLTMAPGELPYLTSARFLEAVQAEDGLALQVIAEAAEQLAIALSGVINFTNPELIILGGPLGLAGSALLEPLLLALRRRTLPLPLSQTRFEVATLGNLAVGLGLSASVLGQLGEVALASV